MQIVNESVKAVLSDNKKLMSVSLVALIQTLKADPKMIGIICKILAANDSEQYKDNNNDITKYLEANKDSIVDLAKKHYENLVEVLTNNTIDSAVADSSLPYRILSLSGL